MSKGAVKTNSGKATLVLSLRVALPPRAQTERNSVTDAVTNCEFDLEDIVECERVIRETKHLSTDADSSTDTTVGWTKNSRKPKFFEKRKKSSKMQKLKTA